MAEFTDKEIRAAYRDAKRGRAIALACELPDQARLEHVKMAALFRWMDARATRTSKLSGPAVEPKHRIAAASRTAGPILS